MPDCIREIVVASLVAMFHGWLRGNEPGWPTARIDGFEASLPKTNEKRYLPPTRTSASQESSDMPVNFGAHHRLISSG